jgi:23S rRNA pseudouridine1911/1915/1917 synthase
MLDYQGKIMKIPILYEDKDVLVINKPAGLIVHSDGKTKEKTLVDWILKKYPRMKNVGEPIIQDDGTKILRPGIVHRIDKDTTGALIIAKNQKSFEFLKGQFKNRKVHKVYQAFVYGDLKEERGMIDRPIGRSSNDFRKWSAQRGMRGERREAITYFKVLNKKDGITFVEAMPKTGRTHQIRVHFSAINHPIVCDKLYATDFYLNKKQQLGFKRMALHARELEITLPGGKLLNIIAPYPEDFEKAILNFKK